MITMQALDISNTFDSTTALSGMFLWIIFGYLSALLNCDLQRFLKHHPMFIHLMGIVAFFFLFTLIDTNNKTSILNVWIKTLFIYVLFVLMIKSKWYFVVPVLVLLLIDQTMKKDLTLMQASNLPLTEDSLKNRKSISKTINVMVIALIISGVIHYAYIQHREYKHKFSWYMFFFGITKCKRV